MSIPNRGGLLSDGMTSASFTWISQSGVLVSSLAPGELSYHHDFVGLAKKNFFSARKKE
eukprot:COSAG04_NODE_25831_length_302_cov_1.768473_1_plen_58_part_10